MSGPANTSRTPVDLEEFEALLRRPHGSAPTPVEPHAEARPDPLAELARLVEGQRLPFVKPVAPEQQDAAPRLSDDWDLRGSAPEAHHGQPALAPVAPEEDPYARNLYSQPAPVPPPPGAWRQEDAVWESDVEPQRKSRKAIYAMGGALCVVLAGVAGTYAFRSTPATEASAPTIKAVSGPLKVVPETPAPAGGATTAATSTVLDKSGEKIGSSRVVSSEEQPVDLSQVRTATIPAANAPARPNNAFPEPIKVKTVSVRPDGTIISPAETAARPTNPPIMPPQQRTASAASAPQPAVPAAAAPAPAPAAPAGSAAKTTNRVAAPTEAPAAKPVQTAAATPVQAPSVAKGGFAVQLAAAGSEAEARDKIGKYQRQFASSLNGHAPGVVKGDVNGKSVWRIRVGGLAREEALSICTGIKDAGGACFVAAN